MYGKKKITKESNSYIGERKLRQNPNNDADQSAFVFSKKKIGLGKNWSNIVWKSGTIRGTSFFFDMCVRTDFFPTPVLA